MNQVKMKMNQAIEMKQFNWPNSNSALYDIESNLLKQIRANPTCINHNQINNRLMIGHPWS